MGLVTKDATGFVGCDIDNKPPGEGGDFETKLLPNVGTYTYLTANKWKKAEEMINSPANLFKAYIYSCKRNPRWQNEYPLYRLGKVNSIIDTKYMLVQVYGLTAGSIEFFQISEKTSCSG